MPRVSFDGVGEAQDFPPLPKGDYPCDLTEVDDGKFTKNGDEMWNIRFRVKSGPHKGRLIFDNMIFSERALSRVKLICSRMGLDVSDDLDVTPSLIKGRSCLVSVIIEEDKDQHGNVRRRNRVPFAGYKSIDEKAPNEAKEDSAPEDSGNSSDPEGEVPF